MYLSSCEVSLIEVLEIMAQILLLLYIIFLRLKPTKMTSEFILSYLKKGIGGATTQKYQKQIQKPLYLHYGCAPGGLWGVNKSRRPK